MPIDIVRHKFNQYRKWFQILEVVFINLPQKYQDNFIILLEQFIEKCRKIHNGSQSIKEKRIQVTVTRMVPQKGKPPSIRGSVLGFKDEIELPGDSGLKIGDKVLYTVYSLDKQVWYSSKKELLATKEI